MMIMLTKEMLSLQNKIESAKTENEREKLEKEFDELVLAEYNKSPFRE